MPCKHILTFAYTLNIQFFFFLNKQIIFAQVIQTQDYHLYLPMHLQSLYQL